jgi:VWFA-related protein
VPAHEAQPPPQLPRSAQDPFRAGITVVPVDVRVVDRDGKPITDLTREDFTLEENGVRQQIVNFAVQRLAPQASSDLSIPDQADRERGSRRFLLVLGRGRHVGPVEGVEAAMRFVKERLLPADQVAIIAYNRSTEFSADHAAMLATLERYWERHEKIEQGLRARREGQRRYGYRDPLPASIQSTIDDIFRVPGAPSPRSVFTTGVSDGSRVAGVQSLASPVGRMSLDRLIENHYGTHTDLATLYNGIRYLQPLNGEKHLILLTPNGVFLPRAESARHLAEMASDARVAIHVVHTHGMLGADTPRASRSRPGTFALPSTYALFSQRFAIQSSKDMARLTGGQAAAFVSGESAFKRLDETTRVQYLLGFVPANKTIDGKFRKISVKVNRKGLTVLHRHGYVTREVGAPRPVDQEHLKHSRVATALALSVPLDDLKVVIERATFDAKAAPHTVAIAVHLAPDRIVSSVRDGLHVGRVEIAYFCGDDDEVPVGELWQTIDLKLKDVTHEQFQRDGLRFVARVPVTGTPKYAKVVVYDPAADRLGSAFAAVKRSD